jgi:glycosyltransferase involved in cell wall biosynthesis
MCQRYAEQVPIAELAVHMGLGEEEHPARDGADVLWLGRIDAQKAPHLAVRAAGLLGQRIVVAGPVFDATYVEAYRDLFCGEGVEMVGEIAGEAKMRLLGNARVLVYTCAREYIEAGAATFGEALRAGTPVAALAWRADTCAHAALCAATGSIAEVSPEMSDDAVVESLAAAVERVARLRARDVQELGRQRFDPARHVKVLLTRSC